MNLYIGDLKEINRDTSFSLYRGRHYEIGEWVTYRNTYFKCIKTHDSTSETTPDNKEYWNRSISIDDGPTLTDFELFTDDKIDYDITKPDSVVDPSDENIYYRNSNAWYNLDVCPLPDADGTNLFWTQCTDLTGYGTTTTIDKYIFYNTYLSSQHYYSKNDIIWTRNTNPDISYNYRLWVCIQAHYNYEGDPSSIIGAFPVHYPPIDNGTGAADYKNYWSEIHVYDETATNNKDLYPGIGYNEVYDKYIALKYISDTLNDDYSSGTIEGIAFRKYRAYPSYPYRPSELLKVTYLSNSQGNLYPNNLVSTLWTTVRTEKNIYWNVVPSEAPDDYQSAKAYGAYIDREFSVNSIVMYDGYLYECIAAYTPAKDAKTGQAVVSPRDDTIHWKLATDNAGHNIPVYEFDFEGVIDDYISVEWIDRYSEFGTFVAKLPVNDRNKSLIALNKYVQYGNHPTLMYIDTYRTYHDTNDYYIQISGKSLSGLLDRRVVFPQENFDGVISKDEGGLIWSVDKLVEDLFVLPDQVASLNDTTGDIIYYFPERATNIISVKHDRDYEDLHNKLLKLKTLNSCYSNDTAYDVLSEICKANGIGFKMNFIRGSRYVKPEFQFEVYRGLDRTTDRAYTDVMPALFSAAFDNLKSSEFTQSNEGYKNLAISYKTKACDSYIDLRDFNNPFDSNTKTFSGLFSNTTILEALAKTDAAAKIKDVVSGVTKPFTSKMRWKLILAFVYSAEKIAVPTIDNVIVSTTQIEYRIKTSSKKPVITLNTDSQASETATDEIWHDFTESSQYEWITTEVVYYACEKYINASFLGDDATDVIASVLKSTLNSYSTASSRVKYLYETSSQIRSGLDRREVYVEKRDDTEKWSEEKAAAFSAGSNNVTMLKSDSDIEETDEQTLVKLKKTADTALGEYRIETDVSAELDDIGTFRFNVDFFLGDIVEVDDGLNNRVKMFVKEFSISDDDTGITKTPVFEKYNPIPERFSKLHYISFAKGRLNALNTRYVNDRSSDEAKNELSVNYIPTNDVYGYYDQWVEGDVDPVVWDHARVKVRKYIYKDIDGAKRPEYVSYPIYISILYQSQYRTYTFDDFEPLWGPGDTNSDPEIKRFYARWTSNDTTDIIYTRILSPILDSNKLFVKDTTHTDHVVEADETLYTLASTSAQYNDLALYIGPGDITAENIFKYGYVKTINIGLWDPAYYYSINKLVVYNGFVYQSLGFGSNKVPPEQPTYWKERPDLFYPYPLAPGASRGPSYPIPKDWLHYTSIVNDEYTNVTFGVYNDQKDYYPGDFVQTIENRSGVEKTVTWFCVNHTNKKPTTIETDWEEVSSETNIHKSKFNICTEPIKSLVIPEGSSASIVSVESPIILPNIITKTSYAGTNDAANPGDFSPKFMIFGTSSSNGRIYYLDRQNRYEPEMLSGILVDNTFGFLLIQNSRKHGSYLYYNASVANPQQGEEALSNIRHEYEINYNEPDLTENGYRFKTEFKRDDGQEPRNPLVYVNPYQDGQNITIYNPKGDYEFGYKNIDRAPYIGISGCYRSYPVSDSTVPPKVELTDETAGLYFMSAKIYEYHGSQLYNDVYIKDSVINFVWKSDRYGIDPMAKNEGWIALQDYRSGQLKTESSAYRSYQISANVVGDILEFDNVAWVDEFSIVMSDGTIDVEIDNFTNQRTANQRKHFVLDINEQSKVLAHDYVPVQDTQIINNDTAKDSDKYGLFDRVTGEYLSLYRSYPNGTIYFTNGGVSNDDE